MTETETRGRKRYAQQCTSKHILLDDDVDVN